MGRVAVFIVIFFGCVVCHDRVVAFVGEGQVFLFVFLFEAQLCYVMSQFVRGGAASARQSSVLEEAATAVFGVLAKK